MADADIPRIRCRDSSCEGGWHADPTTSCMGTARANLAMDMIDVSKLVFRNPGVDVVMTMLPSRDPVSMAGVGLGIALVLALPFRLRRGEIETMRAEDSVSPEPYRRGWQRRHRDRHGAPCHPLQWDVDMAAAGS